MPAPRVLGLWRICRAIDRNAAFPAVLRAKMCTHSAASSSNPEVNAVVEGLGKFLHIHKKMGMSEARSVASNANGFVQQVLESFRKTHSDNGAESIAVNIDNHLLTMKINKVLLFYESLGMENLEDKARISLLTKKYHNVVEFVGIMEEIGVQRKSIGKLVDNNKFVLEGNPEEVQNLIKYLHSNYFTQESFEIICTRYPHILTRTMKSEWEPFMQAVRDFEIQEPAVRRLVRHFGFLLVDLAKLDFARTLEYLQIELNLEKDEISKILKSHPEALLMDLDRTIKSKVEFLNKHNIKNENLSRVVTRCPGILGYSVNSLQAKISYLESLGVNSYSIKKILIAYPAILAHSVESKMKPAVQLLENAGISGDKLVKLILKRPAIFALDTKERLPDILENLKDLGPDGTSLVISWGVSEGVHPMKSRIRYLKSLGFSNEQLVEMLSKDPRILKISKPGLELKVRYLTDEMGFSLESLIGNPTYLYSHFERRIKMRYEVLKLLHDKGELVREPQLSQILYPDNKNFIQRYVNPYKECVSLVKKHYKMFQRHPDGDHQYMMKYLDAAHRRTLER